VAIFIGMRWWPIVLMLVGCAGSLRTDPYAPRVGAINPGAAVPSVQCAGTPKTDGARGFRTPRHAIVTRFASPHHRGYDLIATNTDAQVLRGKLAYGVVDKTLDREDVELYACLAGDWQLVGTTRTDARGRFELALSSPLPVGLRDLYASVVADRSGTHFLAFVAPAGSKVVVSDVDGTLTASESLFVKAVLLGRSVAAHPDAAAALRLAVASGYQVIYITARGDRFTDAPRAWLAANGVPRGPVRLAPSFIVKPGAPTVAYKHRALLDLQRFDVRALGNRSTDVAAYEESGIRPEHIFIKLPEYTAEVSTSLRAGAAIGFGRYRDFKNAL
jgi:phosphatidate phosphatase PAH1